MTLDKQMALAQLHEQDLNTGIERHPGIVVRFLGRTD